MNTQNFFIRIISFVVQKSFEVVVFCVFFTISGILLAVKNTHLFTMLVIC